MDEPRRINLRVEEDLYRKLDDKRHALRTTFQAVGVDLFLRWLQGEQAAGTGEANVEIVGGQIADIINAPAEDLEVVRRVLKVLKSGHPDAIENLLGSIRISEMIVRLNSRRGRGTK